jgi:hypothetical protein
MWLSLINYVIVYLIAKMTINSPKSNQIASPISITRKSFKILKRKMFEIIKEVKNEIFDQFTD